MVSPLLDALQLRPATLADVPCLERWDLQPHVIAATTDDPDEDDDEDQYWPEELRKTAADYQYLIAELSGRPIGAMLIIDPHTEASHYWGAIEPGLRALDIWIGMADDLGKGYGEQMMRRAFQRCFAAPDVNAIVIDPLTSNLRAHKFYQRIGFLPEGRRQFADSDCLVHRLARARWRALFPED